MANSSHTRPVVSILALAALAALAYFLFFSRPSNEDIGRKVAEMMQRELDTKPPLSALQMRVRGVDVMHSEGNKYSGIAHIDLHGETHDVPVDILADGDQIMMQVRPGSFMFVAPELMKQAQ